MVGLLLNLGIGLIKESPQVLFDLVENDCQLAGCENAGLRGYARAPSCLRIRIHNLGGRKLPKLQVCTPEPSDFDFSEKLLLPWPGHRSAPPGTWSWGFAALTLGEVGHGGGYDDFTVCKSQPLGMHKPSEDPGRHYKLIQFPYLHGCT